MVLPKRISGLKNFDNSADYKLQIFNKPKLDVVHISINTGHWSSMDFKMACVLRGAMFGIQFL
jgi:hypothetical protein